MNGLSPICPYCSSFSEQVNGDIVYPHRKDLSHLTFYICKPCDAYVGCHGTSSKPLGRLANAELRKAKNAAHRAFDPIWKSKLMNRKQAYKWLAESLGVDGSDCHIGMFDVETCKKVESLSFELQGAA